MGDRTREATRLQVNPTLGAVVTAFDERRPDQPDEVLLDTTARCLEELGRPFLGPRHEADSRGPLLCGGDRGPRRLLGSLHVGPHR